MNKASEGDGIPAEPFQILKDDAVKVLLNLQLQFIKFLVILPFNFQLSLHLERGTHHAY